MSRLYFAYALSSALTCVYFLQVHQNTGIRPMLTKRNGRLLSLVYQGLDQSRIDARGAITPSSITSLERKRGTGEGASKDDVIMLSWSPARQYIRAVDQLLSPPFHPPSSTTHTPTNNVVVTCSSQTNNGETCSWLRH